MKKSSACICGAIRRPLRAFSLPTQRYVMLHVTQHVAILLFLAKRLLRWFRSHHRDSYNSKSISAQPCSAFPRGYVTTLVWVPAARRPTSFPPRRVRGGRQLNGRPPKRRCHADCASHLRTPPPPHPSLCCAPRRDLGVFCGMSCLLAAGFPACTMAGSRTYRYCVKLRGLDGLRWS